MYQRNFPWTYFSGMYHVRFALFRKIVPRAVGKRRTSAGGAQM